MPEDILQLLRSLQQRITELRRQGDDARALPIAVRLNALVREHLGEGHPDYAASLNALGGVYQAMGDHAAAEPLYRQALDAARRTLGEGHPDVAHNLSSLGSLYMAMGNYAAAEPLYRQALEVRRAALGEEHPHFAATLNNLGTLYRAVGNYAAAEPLHRQALAIVRRELGENHPYFAATLSNLAACCILLGDYAAAEPLYRQALETRRRIAGEAHPDLAAAAHNLAQLHRLMGDYAAAEPLYRQALAIRCETLGGMHPDVADTLDGLGHLCCAAGDYAAAEAMLEQALRIRRSALGGGHATSVASACSLAELHRLKGDMAAAEGLYRQALEARRRPEDQENPECADVLLRLAGLHCSAGDYVAAEPLYHRSLAVRRAVLGEHHPQTAASIDALAGFFHAKGDPARAEPLYHQALQARRAALGDEHADVAATLTGLGALAAAAGRIPEALALLSEAASIDDRVLAQLPALRSVADRTALARAAEGRTAVALSLLRLHAPEIPDAACRALDLLLRRKPIVLEALTRQRAGALIERHPVLRPELSERDSLCMRIAQAVFAGPGPDGLEAHRQLLARWRLRKERLDRELVERVPDIALERRLRSVCRELVARALPEGSALVKLRRTPVLDFGAVPAQGEPWWLPARYLAVVLPAGDPNGARLVDLGDARAIDGAVSAFLSLAAGADAAGAADEEAAGRALFTAVVEPLVGALGDARRLFIVPDGELVRVPFAALPMGDGRRLIDAYLTSYLSCGADLLRLTAAPSARSAGVLVAADPDYDLAAGTPTGEQPDPARRPRGEDEGRLFDRVPVARAEGERVAGILGARPWLGAEVLEGPLKKACRSAGILHLSTQGFFLSGEEADLGPERGPGLSETGERLSPLRPGAPLLRSGLALAGANTWLRKRALPPEAGDGLLTAEEIAALDLLGTELVVVSGCETALTREPVGEGLLGLRGAFTLAGARTLVLSLWVSPDARGSDLLADFYRRVLAGVPRAQALREAQLATKERDPLTAAWGGFILQGDPGPLPDAAPA